MAEELPDLRAESTQDRLAELLARVLAALPDERRALLGVHSDGDLALEREIESLVEATERAGRFLAHVEVSAAPALMPDTVAAGTLVGRYALVRPLGEGGFGSVWLAEQRQPVKRIVALKLIKPGMDTRQVIARFEVERQALAMLDHPNIAKILDAGTTGGGRPYFVMEWIDGVPISDYCQKVALGTRERLGLFVQACQAIQHAHQKGIIHRDIKPNNVLVAVQHGVPTPKVIDFGIAKATSDELRSGTQQSDLRQLVGTPSYMSPEQAELSTSDVDTRSDIYSLGVLLYELLTNATPFDTQALASLGLAELQRVIREETPLRPSVRVSTAFGSGHARRRGDTSSVERDGAALRGDLDWIVMRCLEKDRDRRYGTATALADDILRYLADQPVSAGPPSKAYRLRKFLRRNRGPVAASALTLAVLLIGVAGTVFGLFRALESSRRADSEAERARTAAAAEESAKLVALAAQRVATQRADELELVSTFQSEQLARVDVQATGLELRQVLLEAVDEAEREGAAAAIASVDFAEVARLVWERRLLNPTIEAIDERFEAQPSVRARLLQASAAALRSIGSLGSSASAQTRAVALFEEALGDQHEETLLSRLECARILENEGDYLAASIMVEALLHDIEELLGSDQIAYYAALDFLGHLRTSQGQFSDAKSYLLEALNGMRQLCGPESPEALGVEIRLGLVLVSLEHFAEAEVFLAHLLPRVSDALGENHRETLRTRSVLAIAQSGIACTTDAERSYVAVAQGYRHLLGEGHPLTLTARSNLGAFLEEQNRLDEAEVELRAALAGRRAVLGEAHPQTIMSVAHLGSLARVRGDFGTAEELFQEALHRGRKALGPDHPTVLDWLGSLGHLRWAQKRFREAVPCFREAVERGARTLHPNDSRLRLAKANLGVNLRESGDLEEAVRWLTEAYRGDGTEPDPKFAPELLSSFAKAGKTKEALNLRRELLAEARTTLPAGSVALASKLSECGLQLMLGEEHVDAEALLRESLAIREREEPEAWTTCNARAVLGAALLGQGRLTEAEPLLLAGFTGLLEREDAMPVVSRRGIDNTIVWLVRLYTRARDAGDTEAAAKVTEWTARHESRRLLREAQTK